MTAGPALEMWSRQGATLFNNGVRSEVTFQRAFTVTLDPGDSIEVAYTAAGLPSVSSLYPGTFSVYLENYTVERPSPVMAIVIANYKGEAGISGDPGTTSPVDSGYSLRWGVTVEDLEIDSDYNGEPIKNANDEPITGLREKFYDDVVYITRNFLYIDRYALRQYRRAVNSDTFLGWPPGTARLVDDEAVAVYAGGTLLYWRVSAAIQFREPYRTTADKAWWKRVLHTGFTVRDTASASPHPAWVYGQPTTTPVGLKIDGTLSDPLFPADWREFQTLGYLPYSALGLV